MPARGRASSLKVGPGGAAKPAPAGSTTVKAGEWYVLRRGDRMSTIAKRAYGSIERWPELWARNLSVVKDPDDVQEGTAFGDAAVKPGIVLHDGGTLLDRMSIVLRYEFQRRSEAIPGRQFISLGAYPSVCRHLHIRPGCAQGVEQHLGERSMLVAQSCYLLLGQRRAVCEERSAAIQAEHQPAPRGSRFGCDTLPRALSTT